MNNTLTKTGFQSGLQCPLKLRFDILKSIEKRIGSGAALRFARGKEVDTAARMLRNVTEIVSVVDVVTAAETTATNIKVFAKIAQATFLHDDLSARLDIIEKIDSETWNLIEVKMSGELKEDEHIPDVAFQKYVAEKAGLSIKDCFVMHLNKNCVAPDFSNLFVCVNVTRKVAAYREGLPATLNNFQAILGEASDPSIRVGRHCGDPHDCHYRHHCWKDVPFHSVFTISGIRQNKLNQLLDQSIWEVIKVPDSFELSPAQKKYVEVVKSGSPYICRETIQTTLLELSFPIYFLDFEADRPTIPWINGMRPYELLPFQFCVHKLESDGSHSCMEYLHPNKTDPRKELATELCKAIGLSGSVVTYTTAMENQCIDALVKSNPEFATQLESLKERMWDQSKIFSKHFIHPGFAGKYSLKVVSPVIVPSISYDDANVNNGEAAVYHWIKMIESADAEERSKIETDLKNYCRIDSLSMLEIHKYLCEL